MKTPQSTKKTLIKTLIAWLSLYVSFKTLAKVVGDETKDRHVVAIQGVTTGIEAAAAIAVTSGFVKAVRGRHE